MNKELNGAPIQDTPLQIGDYTFESRLFVGTGKFASNSAMQSAIASSGSQVVTVALKRVEGGAGEGDHLVQDIMNANSAITLMPNTSGVKSAQEAILAAEMAHEALGSTFVKIEIHPDPKYLLPDPIETLKAVEVLAKKGFTVLPYIQADPVLCRHLEEAGAAAVMPLGAPIGTNKGLITRDLLAIIIEQAHIPVVIDAGIGAPSHAAAAMEMGADAVLVNTAIATAAKPDAMAYAFRMAVEAGRAAYLAGLPAQNQHAQATSPLNDYFAKHPVNPL